MGFIRPTPWNADDWRQAVNDETTDLGLTDWFRFKEKQAEAMAELSAKAPDTPSNGQIDAINDHFREIFRRLNVQMDERQKLEASFVCLMSHIGDPKNLMTRIGDLERAKILIFDEFDRAKKPKQQVSKKHQKGRSK